MSRPPSWVLLLCCTLGAVARAQAPVPSQMQHQAAISIDCPALGDEARAALLSRMLLELGLNLAAGVREVRLRCRGLAVDLQLNARRPHHVSAQLPAESRQQDAPAGATLSALDLERVELLLGMLLGALHAVQQPAEPEPATARPLEPPAPASEKASGQSLWSIAVGSRLKLGSGGPGPGADLELRAGWSLQRHWEANAWVSVPVVAPRFSDARGSARLDIVAAAASVNWRGAGRLEPVVGASVGASWVRVGGEAVAPYRSSAARLVQPFAEGYAALRWRLVSHQHAPALELGVAMGALAQPIVVDFAGEHVAEFGQPYAALGLLTVLPF